MEDVDSFSVLAQCVKELLNCRIYNNVYIKGYVSYCDIE